jgi:hypothetical protein
MPGGAQFAYRARQAGRRLRGSVRKGDGHSSTLRNTRGGQHPG